ncbi:TD and POZ domain-containing protein 5 [Caerostris extrusa]|uniref:TD and POZ domain-containing protein 5 n=1 Tax=Caerostris extrusa TaxID=172846 RepID=A0AAV4WA78_CAEEX|nr:TD and POZ domain-containing protein 5 [Caerostris extrusa]
MQNDEKSKETGGFTIVWKIKNFEYCLQKNREPLKSPSFTVNHFAETKWHLLLYPGGVEDDTDIGFYLYREESKGAPEDITIDFELSIISEGESFTKIVDVQDHVFSDRHGYGISSFITRDGLFQDNRDILLPDDTFTVRCRMWYHEASSSTRKEGIINTRIGIEKGSFKWSIKDFSNLRVGQERSLSVESSLKEYPSMSLNLSLTGGYLHDRHVKIEISQINANRPNFAVFKIHVLNCYGKVLEFIEDEHWFDKKDGLQVWELPSLITRERLISKPGIYLPKGVLTLKCDCVLSIGVEFEEIHYRECFADLDSESESEISNQTPDRERWTRRLKGNEHAPFNFKRYGDRKSAQKQFPSRQDLSEVPQSFRSDIQSLYKDQVLPDFNLKVGVQTFPVHKAILSARSPVFKAMFSNDMLEQGGNFTDVLDLDSETMHRFLIFVYTDITEENLDWSALSKLYFAADKYEVLSLKQRCSEFLKMRLCPDNVCDVLTLADMHQDDHLKSAVKDFLLQHDRIIFHSEEWKKLEKVDQDLAFETMRELYLKKLSLQQF